MFTPCSCASTKDIMFSLLVYFDWLVVSRITQKLQNGFP